MVKPGHFLPILLFAAITVLAAIPFPTHPASSNDLTDNFIAGSGKQRWHPGMVANGNGAISPAEARYPTIVDEWVDQAKLPASDGTGGDYFGRSLSLTTDGNIALLVKKGNGSVKKSNTTVYIIVFR
jgi:hypothetical protein